MEYLHPDAQQYLESLREPRPEPKMKTRSLDWWHGYFRAEANNPLRSVEARKLYADKARAVEIRFKELDLIALLES